MIPQIIGGVLRHVLTVVGGSLVTQGWLDDQELTGAIGAILTLIGIGWSVWQKSRKRTEDGGEFNPRAEVRKVEPVQRPGTGGRGGLNKGYVRLPVLVAAVCWMGLALGIVLFMEALRARDAETFRVERYPDVTITPDLALPSNAERSTLNFQLRSGEEIRWTLPVDERPFLVRLLASLRPWGEVGTDKGKVRVDEKGAEVAGAYKDDEKPSAADLVPTRMGIGIAGGAEY